MVHFCIPSVPVSSDLGECGVNLHHMSLFRHFMFEYGVFLHSITNPSYPIIGSFMIGNPQFIDSLLCSLTARDPSRRQIRASKQHRRVIRWL